MNRARLAQTLAPWLFAGASAAAVATGCGSGESLVGGACAAGYTECAARCVDLEADRANCGACGRACLAEIACHAGVCGTPVTDASLEAAADGAGGSQDATTEDVEPVGDGAPGEGTSPNADGSIIDGANAGDAASGGDSSGGAGGASDASSETGGPGDTSAEDGASPDVGADSGCPAGVYDSAQACGDCFTVCSGTTPLCAPEDGGFGCVAMCAAPLAPCGGECIDTSSDESNCGGCGIVCASQICQNSQCVGTAAGGIVFIGHDYQTTPLATTHLVTTQDRVLSNAVFIPTANPLRVLSYDRYASPAALSRIGAILKTVAGQLGRTLDLNTTTIDDDVPNMLSLQNYDVFLMPDQPAAPGGALGMLGPVMGGDWAPTLTTFAQNGGVVVVLDGGGGVGEMPDFVTGTGLLSVTSQTPLALGAPLNDVARGDVEGVGLLTPYGAGGNSVSVTTEPNTPNVVYVIVTTTDAGPGSPVVIHKVF